MTLELRHVTVRYGASRDAVTAVDGIDLAVARGRTLGLVGESGCGKSTVAKAIVGLLRLSAGQILLDGVDHSDHGLRTSRTFRRRVQMVFQDPYSSLNPRMTIGEAIAEVLATHFEVSGSPNRHEQLNVLEMVGLPTSSLDRYPHELSGGQRQRVAIARALSVKPDIIINDEITSSLDVSVQAAILNLLRDLQRTLGLTMLFISHDLSIVRYISDDVAVMYLGRVVEYAPTEELFGAPSHPYTQALIASIPQIGQPRRSAPLPGEVPDPRRAPLGCRFHPRCPIGPRAYPDRLICLQKDPQVIAADMSHNAACHFAARQAPRSSSGDSLDVGAY